MPTYTVQLPSNISAENIEYLRGLGSVTLTFEVEGNHRLAVARELGHEYEWIGYDESWWEKRLRVIRGKSNRV